MSTQNKSKNHEIAKIIERQLGEPVLIVEKEHIITATFNKVSKSCECSPSAAVSPEDVFDMADKLNIRSEEFIITYCSISISSSTGFPTVTLKANGKCKFIDGDECKLGTAKPTPCALFPVSRVMTLSADANRKREQILFVPKRHHTNGDEHTIEEWLKINDIDRKDIQSEEYHNFIADVLCVIDMNKLHKSSDIPEDIKSGAIAALITRLYGKYTPNSDRDMSNRYESAMSVIDTLIKTYPHLKKENNN